MSKTKDIVGETKREENNGEDMLELEHIIG